MRLAALAALLLGLAADLLLRHVPWGLNALLWTALFVVTTIVLQRRERPQPWLATLAPATAALLAAAGMAWRASETLVALDALVLLGSLTLLSLSPRGVRASAAGLTRIAFSLLVTFGQSVAGFFQLFEDIEWRGLPRRGGRVAGIAIRGVLLALPALILFGVLLASADETFARLLRNLFAFELDELLQHAVVTLVVAAMTGGFLRSLLRGDAAPWGERPASLRLGAPEVNIALGLINALFALFVAVQFQHFFGRTPTLSHSEDARLGFFELVWVVVLVLPLLLVAEWIVDKAKPLLTRLLMLLQIGLVFVIAASAYRRMQAYREAFGLTELRFYTTAFMIWIGVLLVWFCLTVLTGHRERFAIGALVSAVAAVVALHVINPDDTIVRTNFARGARGERPFDAPYAGTLSDDAVPFLVQHLEALPPCTAMPMTRPEPKIGFRTWNASRVAAQDARRAHKEEIARAAAQCAKARQESKATPPIGR